MESGFSRLLLQNA